MTALLLKIALAPALVVGSSWAGRRWGARVAGALVALPVVAGPILLVVAIEQGERFVAQAASAALLGLGGVSAFVLVYALMARDRDWPRPLAVAFAHAQGGAAAARQVQSGFLAAAPAFAAFCFLVAVLSEPWGVVAAFALATAAALLAQPALATVGRRSSSGMLSGAGARTFR